MLQGNLTPSQAPGLGPGTVTGTVGKGTSYKRPQTYENQAYDASLSPSRVRQALHSMMTPPRKRAAILKKSHDAILGYVEHPNRTVTIDDFKLVHDVPEKLQHVPDNVRSLQNKIQTAAETRAKWKMKAIQHMNFFPRDELYALYRLIFLPALEQNNNSSSSSNSNSNSNHNKYNHYTYFQLHGLTELDLFDKAFDHTFPRADLADIYIRVRTVVAQIEQMRSKRRESVVSDMHARKNMARDLGPLVYSRRFKMLLDDDELSSPIIFLLHSLLKGKRRVATTVINHTMSISPSNTVLIVCTIRF